MSDLKTIRGFEEVWPADIKVRGRRPETLLGWASVDRPGDARARLTRLMSSGPQVMVKGMGATHTLGALRAQLNYISRGGQVELEDRDGVVLLSRAEVRELANDWTAVAGADRRRRVTSPISHSIVLSMPAGTDPTKVRDSGRAFALNVFASEHDYVFAFHSDAPNPHVHLTICSRGDTGRRLYRENADWEIWRTVFAQELRKRGIEAEATPNWARGVTPKGELTSLRKIRERHEAGLGEMSRVRRAGFHEAGLAAFGGNTAPTPGERRLADRQDKIRALYLAQAKVLGQSADPEDRALSARVEAFVRQMPPPDSRRLALARELRVANRALERERRSDGFERSR